MDREIGADVDGARLYRRRHALRRVRAEGPCGAHCWLDEPARRRWGQASNPIRMNPTSSADLDADHSSRPRIGFRGAHNPSYFVNLPFRVDSQFMASRPTISVIIPALNEEVAIGQAIEGAWQAGAEEVIVVDGGSGDQTVRRAEARKAKVVCSEPGRGQQQNLGASVASGDVYLFLHADNSLSVDALDQVRAILADPRVVTGGFRQRIDAPGIRYRVLEFGNELRAKLLRLPYGDQGIFVRRETFDEVGGFPNIPLMEDVGLLRRLRKFRRPAILPGPVIVNPRRWQRHGIFRQTLRNWTLLAAYFAGVAPERLAGYYKRVRRWEGGKVRK